MARERVQVQGLGDVAPGIQPTIQRAGQYGIQVQRAGRNKLMDLADALSQVNPILAQYGQIREFQQERDIAAGQQFFTEQPEQAAEALEAGIGKTKRELRKLVQQGVIDERSNPDFLLGIRAARGKTLAKDFRRDLLTNPDALNQEDPVAYIQNQVSEFYQRPEIAGSAYAKQQVQPLLDSISDEYIGQVTRIQQDREIAQGKSDWLGSIVDKAKAWSSNRASLSEDDFKEWIDDGAGNFKGSRKYALDNLFKPVIMDMVERGNTGGAMRKLQELENWVINKKTGAKFVTPELSQEINNLQKSILDSGVYYTDLAVEAYNTKRTTASDPFNAEFQERLNNNLPITESFLTDFSTRVRNSFEDQGVKKQDAENLIAKWREETNKAYNRAKEVGIKTNTEVYADIQNGITLGIDVSNEIEDARDQGLISEADFIKLRNDNAEKAIFEKEVMSLPPVRGYTDLLESDFSNTTIKGGNPYLSKDFNIVTNILKTSQSPTTKLNVPSNTLQALGQEARMMWVSGMEERRNGLIFSNPEISRPQLDRQLGNEAGDVYSNLQPQVQELVLDRLRTGQYDLGLTANDFRKNSDRLKQVITGLKFETAAEARLFLDTYKDRLF
jgi:hypothetical protein